jgi:hypothetical protein
MYSECGLVARFPQILVTDCAIEASTCSVGSRHCYLLQSLLPGGGGYSLLSGEGSRLDKRGNGKTIRSLIEEIHVVAGKLARDQGDENAIRISGDLIRKATQLEALLFAIECVEGQ